MRLLAQIAIVALGGAFGCLCRYLVSQLGVFDQDKYYYTMGINLLGCLLMGILYTLLNHWHSDPVWSVFLLTGCLGGFTTYSAFTLDAIQLIQLGRWADALRYTAITFVGGFACCGLGIWLTDKLCK